MLRLTNEYYLILNIIIMLTWMSRLMNDHQQSIHAIDQSLKIIMPNEIK